MSREQHRPVAGEDVVATVTMVSEQGRRIVVGAAIVDDPGRPRRLLAGRRTEPPRLAGGWELPGGKVDPGETPIEALHREIREELGVGIVLGDRLLGPLPAGSWPLGDNHEMQVWVAAITDGHPEPLEDHDELRWLSIEDLRAVPWLPADLPIIDAFEARFHAP